MTIATEEKTKLTLAVNIEDLQKIIAAANQIEALLELLPDESPVLTLLQPIHDLFGESLYGHAEVASAVLEATGRKVRLGV